MFFPSSPMDISSFYQQLQLSPPAASSPKHPDDPALCGYYPSPAPLATDDGFGRHILDLEAHSHAAAAMMETDNPSPAAPARPPKMDDGAERALTRRDRHSKICTAGGMRDRRMRLSLDVARRFFALQDKLGFDKASKTVQWLLDMSTAGIEDLMMSEDGLSGAAAAEQQIVVDFSGSASAAATKKKRPAKAKALIKGAAASASRKSNASSITTIDKESRARARERARARTKERNRLRWAVLASSISVDEAPPSSSHPSTAMATQMEAATGGAPSLEHRISSYSSRQDQWELSGVVFARGCTTLPLIQ